MTRCLRTAVIRWHPDSVPEALEAILLVPIAALGRSPRIGWIDQNADGTLWIELDDDEGDYAVVCIDSREASPTRSRLFEGARHPAKPEASPIELGSLQEGIAVSTLSAWLDSHEGRRRTRPEAIERIFQLLLRLGEPTLVEPGRSEPRAS